MLIDVYWCILFHDERGTPLSVVDLFQLKRTDKNIRYEFFYKAKGVEAAIVEKNYLKTDIIPFLICDYRNRVYDEFLTYTRPLLPVFVVHFTIFMLRRSYHYRFPMDDYRGIFS